MNENVIAESLRRMAVQQQAMIEAADMFDQIGSIKSVTSEANKERDAALAEVAKAKDAMAKAKEKTAALEKQADEILANAHATAAEVVSQANLQMEKAGKDAAALLAGAEANAKNDAAALNEATKAKLKATEKEITDAETKLVELAKQIEDLEANEADARIKLDRTRDAMKALAGAAA